MPEIHDPVGGDMLAISGNSLRVGSEGEGLGMLVQPQLVLAVLQHFCQNTAVLNFSRFVKSVSQNYGVEPVHVIVPRPGPPC